MDKPYYSFSTYLKNKFKTKVQRISLNAGFNCPNRDGTKDTQGCFFCNEKGFVNFDDPDICLDEQIEKSILFLKERFNTDKFIAYFQNASNTNAPAEKLKSIYSIVRKYPEFVGLYISTRPDCIDEEKLKLIESFNDKYDVWIEYGLQTIHDKTLESINRRHTFNDFKKAVDLTNKFKIKKAAHIILGLPNETRQEMLQTAKVLQEMSIDAVKIHTFHILKNTKFADIYNDKKIKLLEQKEYVEILCDFLENIHKDCIIMRLVSNAKADVLVAPLWINNKHVVIKQIEEEFKRRKTYQGASVGQ